MIGHCSLYLERKIPRVWWTRRKSLDNDAVREGVTVRDFIGIH